MKLFLLTILLVSLFMSSHESSESEIDRIPHGQWKTIRNLNNPYVLAIAHFAITKHNTRAGTELVLRTIQRGESQVLGGRNFKLDLEMVDGAVYRAYVEDKPFAHTRKLISFVKL